MTENDKIEKFQQKKFSPYYTLEISMVCKNCGTSKGRWRAASDSATSFDFILTTCEYCGCFRFAATLFAKFFDNRDEKNLELSKSKFDKELLTAEMLSKDHESPRLIKKVEGERVDD